MAHVLCITTGLSGVLHASFEVARRLEAAGHRVTCLSWSDVGEAVEAQGLRFVALPPLVKAPVPPHPPRGGRGRVGRTLDRYRARRARLDAGADALRVEDHADTLARLDADLALVDVEMHEVVLAAHTIGLPTVLLSQWFSLWSGTGQPPLQSGTVPGRGPSGHPLAVRAEWLRLGGRRVGKRVRRHLGGHPDRSDVLRHLARRLGFPQREWVPASLPPPFVYRTLPVLGMTLAELEFPQRPRPGLHYVGPMVDADRRDVRTTPDVEARLGAVVARCAEAGTSLVYAPASSMAGEDAAFVRTLVGVFARRPDWHLVLGLGGRIDPESLGDLPPNVSAFAWAPQLRVLEAADAAVVPGGINTIHECLHFGVPMAVYSEGLFDRDGCAARVEHHGLGVRGDPGDTGAEVERAIERVLTDPAIRAAVDRMRATYQTTRESGALVRIVESFLPV